MSLSPQLMVSVICPWFTWLVSLSTARWKKGQPNYFRMLDPVNGQAEFLARARTVDPYPLVIATEYKHPLPAQRARDGSTRLRRDLPRGPEDAGLSGPLRALSSVVPAQCGPAGGTGRGRRRRKHTEAWKHRGGVCVQKDYTWTRVAPENNIWELWCVRWSRTEICVSWGQKPRVMTGQVPLTTWTLVSSTCTVNSKRNHNIAHHLILHSKSGSKWTLANCQ